MRTHVNQNELPSVAGCDSLYGVPILTDGPDSSYKFGSRVQANFIKYLVDLMMKRLEATDLVMTDSPIELTSDGLYERLRGSLVITVVLKIGSLYREWFDSYKHAIGQGAFMAKYGSQGGPQKIYQEIFLGKPIAEFLNECLNDVDTSALELDVQAYVRELIIKCLDS